MLAIKECLIREGVLNLNPSNLPPNTSTLNNPAAQYDINRPCTLYRSRYSFGSNLNMLNNSPTKSATDISVNDLSSANSATAKTSCQQQQEQPHSSQSELSPKPQARKLPKRYQGHHPHFHHHTAPAYYTDLHLKIHTPEAKDSVNENYQSVYHTPSKLIKDGHQFPKTAKATLPAPLHLSPRQNFSPDASAPVEDQVSFFRGAASLSEQRQPNYIDPYMPSSEKLLEPCKGKSSSPSDFIVSEDHNKLVLAAPVQPANASASVVFACTNFKPCVENEPQLAAQNATYRGRNTERFASRKRAVRVRSESRPISALYDIICKEKGLDIATTTTNDEDSSPSPSHEDERTLKGRSNRSHSRSLSRQTKPFFISSNKSNMSGSLGNNSSGGDHPQYRSVLQQKKHNDKYSPNTIFINDLSDDDDDDDSQHLEGGCSRTNLRMRNSLKNSNLWAESQQSKCSSLPPGLINLSKFPQTTAATQNYHNSHDSLSNISNLKQQNKESLECVKSSSGTSRTLPDSIANNVHPLPARQSTSSNPLSSSSNTNTSLSVEDPNHAHLSSSCSLLNEQQTKTGAGTINNPSQQLDQLKQLQPKSDRNLRKHRRLRDNKPRRHTDGAIQLFPPELNDLDGDDQLPNYGDNDRRHAHDYSDDDNDDQHHPSQFYDLNGTGHDFHTLSSSAAAANAKRYITRSQRLQQQQEQTNESRSSPTIRSNAAALNVTAQQDLKVTTNCETTTATATKVESNGYTIKTNGEDKETEEEMTNNSGKKSKTTTTVTAAATNSKELKIKIPLTSENTSTIAATAAPVAAVTAATDPGSSLCSSTSDKKKDEEKLQQLRYTSPTSPKPQHYTQHIRRVSPSANCLDNVKQTASGSEAEHNHKMSSASNSPTHRANRKLIPSVSVSMKQNLSETQCIASRSKGLRSNTNSPKSPKQKLNNNSIECTVKVMASPKAKTKLNAYFAQSTQNIGNGSGEIDADFMEINDLPLENNEEHSFARAHCATLYTDSETSKTSLSNGGQTNENHMTLSPVHNNRTTNISPRLNEERDKSSKRKSNLNRSLNEEATPDGDDIAVRRRRRRELGMSRPLVPNDDASLKALISPHKTRVPSPTKPAMRNDLSYHMEMARKGLDLATTTERRRAQTTSPKSQKDSPSPKSAIPISKFSKRCDTVTMGEMRKERSSELNRKLNERTRTGLEEIMKIVENVSENAASPSNAITDLTHTMNRLSASQERENETENLHLPGTSCEEPRRPSPVKHATFMQEECIYYEPDPLEHAENAQGETEQLKGGIIRSQRMLKAKSIEKETSAYEPAKLSPILRRKSTDCPQGLLAQGYNSVTPNHIVSILKKKDHLSAGESSSASSNASPVTFSSSVMDTPSKQKRAGILKKRSSLDESRYYSRSHSPDERSILIKSARRNSLEEVANGISSSSAHAAGHHGILKQSSYDSSKSDGCLSASREPHQPQSILKKKDSTSTPSDGGDHAPKHVSISQAVILAAAELSAATDTGEKFPNDVFNYTPNNEEYDIKPILKVDSSTGEETFKPPKPILKKKSSGDSDEHEIKPILKTSRKSSREEFEFGGYSDGEGPQEPQVKPILKSDSPSKRRSLGEPDSSNQERYQCESLSPFLLKRRTRSLERQDQAPVIDLAAALDAIATSQALPSELVSSLTNTTAGCNISVAERIKSVEKFLANQSSIRSSAAENLTTITNSATLAVTTSQASPLQNDTLLSSSNVAEDVKILKPSVIKRDLYKDRFKTQPVTSDEKNFIFKNSITSANETLPSGSAFKPAQSLEGFGFAHISSHGNQSPNAPPSAFTLTRSFTQPLSSSFDTPPQSFSSLKSSAPVPLPRKYPARSNLLGSQDKTVSTLSSTGGSSLSQTNNSERTFDMSSLEPDVDMTESQQLKTPSNKDLSESSASAVGVVRTNSVKARANMFQQMQQKTGNGAGLNQEEHSSPKRVPRRLSPSPLVHADELKTPSNPPQNPDDEIEPSSLPLSERLRFFSSLSDASKRHSCSFTRSPPFNSLERSSSISSYHYYMAATPRSSTSLSSASVTPTPVESPLPTLMDSPAVLRNNSSASTLVNEAIADVVQCEQDYPDSRFTIKADIVKTSPFLQASKQTPPMPTPVQRMEAETTPISALTPTMKRIKLKTIGKLALPSTFLRNDRNNNNSSTGCSASKELSFSYTDPSAENENSGPPKKIGKIKSPFIENCNQPALKPVQSNSRSSRFEYNNKHQNSPMALSSLENSAEHYNMDISASCTNGISNGSVLSVQRKSCQNTAAAALPQINGHCQNEDFSTDSGKENVDTTPKEETTPVVEIRRKFTRKANTSQSFNNSTSGGMTRQLTPRSASLNGPHSTPLQVDVKYAKYFGLGTATKSAKLNLFSPLPKQLPSTPTANESFAQHLHQSKAGPPPPAAAINRNVRLWQSSTRGIRRMSSVIHELQKFEEIIVTERELKLASKEFDNLLLNDSVLKHSSKEVEQIFSSIV